MLPAIGIMPFPEPIEPLMESLIDLPEEEAVDDFMAGLLPPELSVTPRITPTTTRATAPRPVQRHRCIRHQRASGPGPAPVTGRLLSDSLLTRCLLAGSALG